MRVSIHITTHCCSTHLQHAASPQMGISQLLYLKVTFNICYSPSFSWRGMLISLICHAEFDSLLLHCRFYHGLWGNMVRAWHPCLLFSQNWVQMQWPVKTAGASLQRSNYCNFWNVKRRLELDAGWIISRMKTVSAGGVLVGLHKGQSHQLLFPLRASDSVIDQGSTLTFKSGCHAGNQASAFGCGNWNMQLNLQ